uniref:Cellulase n=1 Tax=Alexandrium monilatum TaxID=311494 RepID=A0A7S4T6Y6_9DINO
MASSVMRINPVLVMVSLAVATSPNFRGSAECVDDNAFCAAWARQGQCQTNPGYMLVVCKKSCSACPATTTTPAPTTTTAPPTTAAPPPAPCVDENSLCAAWARQGQCQANPGYMLVVCKRSCSACPPAPPAPRPGPSPGPISSGTMTVLGSGVLNTGSCTYAAANVGGSRSAVAQSPAILQGNYCGGGHAVNPDGAGCGRCYELLGPTGAPLAVQIVDASGTSTFNCNGPAFRALSGVESGVVDVRYRPVACQTADPPVATVVHHTRWYGKFLFGNLPEPPRSVAITTERGTSDLRRVGVTAQWEGSPPGGLAGSVQLALTLAGGARVSVHCRLDAPPGAACSR